MDRLHMKVAVPYAVILIGDPRGGAPETMKGAPVSSTESCVAVGCRPAPDGETELIVCTGDAEGMAGGPVVDAVLALPSRQVAIRPVTGAPFYVHHVSAIHARVRIWTNHPVEPDRVVVSIR